MKFAHQSEQGFTLIEILAFIIITSLVMSTLLISSFNGLRKAATVYQQWVAVETARSCVEWFLDQRRINGYSVVTCPSTTTPSVCTAPSGYSVGVNIACSTWNSDANYKTITVTVSGPASATLSTEIGSY